MVLSEWKPVCRSEIHCVDLTFANSEVNAVSFAVLNNSKDSSCGFSVSGVLVAESPVVAGNDLFAVAEHSVAACSISVQGRVLYALKDSFSISSLHNSGWFYSHTPAVDSAEWRYCAACANDLYPAACSKVLHKTAAVRPVRLIAMPQPRVAIIKVAGRLRL